MRCSWIGALAVAMMASAAGAQELTLPKDLQWCDTLPVVAEKLGIEDTSEDSEAQLAYGVYMVTGELWGQRGTFTARLEGYGTEQLYLVELEYRMFRNPEALEKMVGKLEKMIGPGVSEVLAKAGVGPNGEVVEAQREKHEFDDPEGRWEVVAWQMSNEIDMLKFSYDHALCEPKPQPDEGDGDEQQEAGGGQGRGDIFNYDKWAEDPLHDDVKQQQKEEEEENQAQEEEKKVDDIDWSDVEDEDEDIDW